MFGSGVSFSFSKISGHVVCYDVIFAINNFLLSLEEKTVLLSPLSLTGDHYFQNAKPGHIA